MDRSEEHTSELQSPYDLVCRHSLDLYSFPTRRSSDLWFSSNEDLAQGKDWPRPRGWASRHWSPAIGSEHAATRDRVAIYDETSFSKMEVVGPGSLSFLQWIDRKSTRLNSSHRTISYAVTH